MSCSILISYLSFLRIFAPSPSLAKATSCIANKNALHRSTPSLKIETLPISNHATTQRKPPLQLKNSE